MAEKAPVQFVLAETETQNMTDWSNEPTIQALKQDLMASKPAHDSQVTKINHWTNLMEVKGSARPPKIKGRSSAQPKLIKRQAEWRYSALSEPFLGSNKVFTVNPVTAADADSAKQNELVLNWQFRTKMNRVKFIDDYVRSCVDEGTVVVRLGWFRKTTKVKQKAQSYDHFPITDDAGLQAFSSHIDLQREDPEAFNAMASPELQSAMQHYHETGEPTSARKGAMVDYEVDKVLENRPTVEVMNPANLFVDPSCNGDLDKALFAIASFETNKAELLKEPQKYKNLDKVNWEANTVLTDQDHVTNTPNDFQFNDRLRKKVVAYEWWGFSDIHGTGELVPIVCTWIGDVIVRMQENPYPDGKLPFVIVPYKPVKRDLYGEPDADLLEDNQKTAGALMRGMIDLLGRSANAQQGFAKGMLDPLNKRRFENGQDYEFNPGTNPNQGYIFHKYPELPQSALMMLNLQNQDAESLSGVKAFASGMDGNSYGDVVAGIKGALDASSKREMSILRRLAKGMTDIGDKIIAMNGVFLSAKEVVRVTDTQFVDVNREDLAGNFHLDVDIATAEVDNQKAQDLAFMLQTMGPNMGQEIILMILADIAELKRMPVLAEKLRNYKPAPNPAAEQQTQLELQKLQMEVQKLQSEVDLNRSRAQLAGTQAQGQDLNNMNDADGTTHARNMQQQAGQAEGNQDLEVTKALLKPQKPDETAPNIDAAVGWNQISKQT